MDEEALISKIRKSICEDVEIYRDGEDRYTIDTSFEFEDGDSYVIILKKTGEEWYFTDEGHTLMHLSYERLDNLLYSGKRNERFLSILNQHDIEDYDGELRSYVVSDDLGSSLNNFIHGLNKIITVAYVSTQADVASMFMDDFKKFMLDAFDDKCKFNYYDEKRDIDKKYIVDCCIEAEKPIFVFALGTDYKCKDAIITCLKFKEWGISFVSIGVFQESEKITRKVQAQSMDTFDKQFSTLSSANEGMCDFMKRISLC